MKRNIATCAGAVLMLSGCAGASSDPHTGGLIGGINGIATGAYDKRIAEKQAELADLETAGDALSRRVGNAQDRLKSLEQMLAVRKAKIERMKTDIAEIDRLLAAGDLARSAQRGALESVQAENSRKDEVLRPLRAERDTLVGMVRELEQNQIVEARNYQHMKTQRDKNSGTPEDGTEVQMAELEKRLQEFEKMRMETSLRLDRVKKSVAEIGRAG